MTREELKEHCEKQIEMCKMWAFSKGEEPHGKIYEEHKLILELLEQEPFMNKPCISSKVCEHIKEVVLDRIRVEIEQELEQEEFARSVFRHEEKDNAKADQCTGSIMAYRNVLKMFDKYKAESEVEDEKVKN